MRARQRARWRRRPFGIFLCLLLSCGIAGLRPGTAQADAIPSYIVFTANSGGDVTPVEAYPDPSTGGMTWYVKTATGAGGVQPSAIVPRPGTQNAYYTLAGANSVCDVETYAQYNQYQGHFNTYSGNTCFNVGNSPGALAITPDGRAAYVVNGGDGTVSPVPLDGANALHAQTAIHVGAHPTAIVTSRDGRWAYVTSDDGVDVLHLPTDLYSGTPTAAAPWAVGSTPGDLALSGDGQTIYVVANGAVIPVTAHNGNLGTPIPVSGAQYISVTPDGSQAYVVSSDDTITGIDTQTWTIAFHSAISSSCSGARRVTFSNTSPEAYVACTGSSKLIALTNVGPSGFTPSTDASLGGGIIGTGNGPVGAAIPPGPLALRSAILSAPANQAYSGGLVSTGGVGPFSWSITSGSLPDGLSLDASTGTISGYTGAGSRVSFTAQVTDSAGATASKQITFVTNPGPPSISTTGLPDGQLNQAYSQTVSATGGLAPFWWAITQGSLPPGLSLSSDGTSGTISGTPTAGGTYTFIVKVADNSYPQQSDTHQYTISVGANALTISTTSVPGGQVGNAYSQALQASQGSPPYTWTVASGTLPPGLTLGSDGTLSGTPTTAGIYSFTANVADSASPAQNASQPLSITVAPGPLSITAISLLDGQVGARYNQPVSTSGGAAPLTWSVTSGSLPPGLTLDSSTGAVSGTPTAAGISTFTVGVTDSWSPVQTASQQYTIGVAPRPGTSMAYTVNQGAPQSITPIDLATGTAGAAWPLGGNPVAAVVSPDGGSLYAADSTHNQVLVLSAATGQQVAAIPLGGTPRNLAVTPDGHVVYASNGSASVTPIQTASNTAGTPIDTTGTSVPSTSGLTPSVMAITPDGQTLYVANPGNSSIAAITTSTGAVTSIYAPCGTPSYLVMSPDGGTLYVGCPSGSSISRISTATNKAGSSIAFAHRIVAMAVSPDGGTLYIAYSIFQQSSPIVPVNTATGAVGSTIAAIPSVGDVAVSADGGTLYVVSRTKNMVVPINLASGRAEAPIATGGYPVAIALAPAQRPATPAITSPATGVYTDGTTVPVGGTAPANSTVNLFDGSGGTPAGTATADGSGNWSIALHSLTAGDHSLTAMSVDGNGVQSPRSGTITVHVDATPLRITSPSNGASVSGGTSANPLVVSGAADPGVTVTFTGASGQAISGCCPVGSDGTWSANVTDLQRGANTMTAHYTDALGNTGAVSLSISNNGPTAGPLLRFTARIVSDSHSRAITRLTWQMAHQAGVLGFTLSARGSTLTRRPIPVHAAPAYHYTVQGQKAGPYTLTVIFRDGSVMRISTR